MKEKWIKDRPQGGGRMVGEVCSLIDLMQFLIDAPPVSVFADSVSAKTDKIIDADSVFITLRFADGSNGSIAFLSEGDRGLPKERVEIFGGGKSFVLDDFRRAFMYRDGREEQITLRAQDKGQHDQVRAVCACVLEGGAAPISLPELASTTRTTFRILDSLRERQPMEVMSGND